MLLAKCIELQRIKLINSVSVNSSYILMMFYTAISFVMAWLSFVVPYIYITNLFDSWLGVTQMFDNQFLFGFNCLHWICSCSNSYYIYGTLMELSMSTITAFSAPLSGVFLLAVFFPWIGPHVGIFVYTSTFVYPPICFTKDIIVESIYGKI